jgi:murein DD-endopeptidase MepM/ murein hydrolase activator NlpD
MLSCVDARRRFGSASLGLLLWGLLTSCVPQVETPAPVVSGAPVERGPLSVTIQRGQSLSEIAQNYHVPMRVIAEANGLSPPYRIKTGRSLIIPGAAPPHAPEAPVSVAALSPSRPDAAASAPVVERPAAAWPEKPTVIDAPLAPRAALSPSPPPVPTVPSTAAAAVPPAIPSVPAAPASPPEPPTAANLAPPGGSGAFIWPVHGNVLATFGSRSDGTHNDGINIGAARGSTVQAADAGVVAYTGNELRGYGNLILVKHAGGWISAYAHCDQILVKRGEKVSRGEVIARVGSTGNVGEPQLHFELRRGNHPVDPRELLAPLPTAATRGSRAS